MAGTQTIVTNFVANPPSLVNGVETVGLTTPKVNSPYPGAPFAISFAIDISTGASATGVNVRVRRDSLTGTIVRFATIVFLTANVITPVVGGFIDSGLVDVAGQIWVVTFTVTGGAAAGTPTNGFVQVISG